MKSLWLTYAWKDNCDQDVDFIVQELKGEQLDVRFDRSQLLAGRRLWDQIDRQISSERLDAWAILVSRNSLASEPCQEEIAYALDRALRTRGKDFPLIGIFPESIERGLIPSAIATRLYVRLDDPVWKKRVADAVRGELSYDVSERILPFGYEWHDFKGQPVLEVWPRIGAWSPFFAGVPISEKDYLVNVLHGPRGFVTGSGMRQVIEGNSESHYFSGTASSPINSTITGHIFFSRPPSEVGFGSGKHGEMFWLVP